MNSPITYCLRTRMYRQLPAFLPKVPVRSLDDEFSVKIEKALNEFKQTFMAYQKNLTTLLGHLEWLRPHSSAEIKSGIDELAAPESLEKQLTEKEVGSYGSQVVGLSRISKNQLRRDQRCFTWQEAWTLICGNNKHNDLLQPNQVEDRSIVETSELGEDASSHVSCITGNHNDVGDDEEDNTSVLDMHSEQSSVDCEIFNIRYDESCEFPNMNSLGHDGIIRNEVTVDPIFDEEMNMNEEDSSLKPEMEKINRLLDGDFFEELETMAVLDEHETGLVDEISENQNMIMPSILETCVEVQES